MIDAKLLSLVPPCRRARDYHLYDGTGTRLLDMYLLGGRALAGHRPQGLSHQFKNVVSRGVWGEMPSVYPGRLKELLAPFFPEHPQLILFPHRFEAERFLADRYGVADFGDPGTAPLQPGMPALWRPLCPASYEGVPALLPILPFPGDFAPAVVCLAEDQILPGKDEILAWELGCSPLLAAALIQAVTLLPKLADNVNQGEWERFDEVSHGLWRRTGPYLAYQGPAEGYQRLFKAALEGGILLHPGPDGPSILPLHFTDGEMAPLRRLMENYGN